MKFLVYVLFCIPLLLIVENIFSRPDEIQSKFIPTIENLQRYWPHMKTKHYPRKHIDKLLPSSGGPISIAVGLPHIDIHSNNMCETRIISKRPKAAVDIGNITKFIVNTKKFRQKVIYESCVNPNSTRYEFDAKPDDIKLSCKQANDITRLLSISHTGKLEYSLFSIPIYCLCSYERLNESLHYEEQSQVRIETILNLNSPRYR